MVDIPLTCNLSSCRKDIPSKACVTVCSHIFCTQHMNSLTGENNRACLACGTPLINELDVVLIDLNPTEQYKMMILNGLAPDQIMEIATRAISFYVYQLNYNIQNRDGIVRHAKEQIEEIKHYCTELSAKFQNDLQKHRHKAENLKRELDEKIKEVEMQQQQVAQWKRANKKLQIQLESQKREMLNMRPPKVTRPPFQMHKNTVGNIGNAIPAPFQFDNLDNYGSTGQFGQQLFNSYGRFSH